MPQPPAQPCPDCRGDSAELSRPQPGHALPQRPPPGIRQQPTLGMRGADDGHRLSQPLILTQILIQCVAQRGLDSRQMIKPGCKRADGRDAEKAREAQRRRARKDGE